MSLARCGQTNANAESEKPTMFAVERHGDVSSLGLRGSGKPRNPHKAAASRRVGTCRHKGRRNFTAMEN